jgi:hypothetical protein
MPGMAANLRPFRAFFFYFEENQKLQELRQVNKVDGSFYNGFRSQKRGPLSIVSTIKELFGKKK